MDSKEIIRQARLEYEQERFRELVEKEKERLRKQRGFLTRIFPFKILIVRK